MTPEQIRHAKILRKSELFSEAVRFYQEILKENPSDKLAILGYAQCLAKCGSRENIKALLYRAEKVLFELIGDDYLFQQAHDELIFLSHRLNHLGNLSKYYNGKLKQYPARDIYEECLKKITGVSSLVLPARGKRRQTVPLPVRIFYWVLIFSLCVVLLLGIFSAKLRSLFFPALLLIGLFIGFGVFNYLKGSSSPRW
ncbi:MAG: tetratricopeptide repeat protein [bacterium]